MSARPGGLLLLLRLLLYPFVAVAGDAHRAAGGTTVKEFILTD